jgi:hypothetical protein
MLSAIAGAGLAASTVVFLCLLMNDLRRGVGPWFVARWRDVVFRLRATAGMIARGALASVVVLRAIARTTVVVEAVWLARAVGTAAGWILVCVAVVGLSVLTYVGIVVAGLVCVSQSTHIVVALLDDPPRELAMALGIGAAIALMYAALGAFALCAWIPYRVARAGIQRAERAISMWRRST